MRRRVTVLSLCVCVYVCVCVSLSVCYHEINSYANVYGTNKVKTDKTNILNVWIYLRFESYNMIYPSPHSLAVSLDNLRNISQTKHYLSRKEERLDTKWMLWLARSRNKV